MGSGDPSSNLLLSVGVALAIGAVSLIALMFRRQQPEEDKKPKEQAELPADGIFTIDSLAKFNGVDGPICLGVCGKVVNVSSSENIKPGEGYGKLWAGKDATYALATLSLKPEDANILEYKVTDFTEEQHKALAGWYKHFTTKYPVVGRLTEYEGWDFSTVEKEAETQTPFASSSGGGAAAAAGAEATVFKAGDRVTIQGLKDKPELNGTQGTLKTYDADKGRFAVALDHGGAQMLFKPGNLVKST